MDRETKWDLARYRMAAHHLYHAFCFMGLFWLNRHLLNSVGKIAAGAVLKIAKKEGVTPAIFIAIHTFGRDLKRNIHIHLSTARGGCLLI